MSTALEVLPTVTEIVDAMADMLSALKLGADARDERWCLVRWVKAPRDETPAYCGPLSYMNNEYHRGLGFPEGQVGDIATWTTEPEAAARAETRSNSIDVANPLHELHFSTEVYSRWDGKTSVLYDEGAYRQARALAALFAGWAQGKPGSNYWTCTVKCRAASTGLRMGGPRRDDAGKALAVAR